LKNFNEGLVRGVAQWWSTCLAYENVVGELINRDPRVTREQPRLCALLRGVTSSRVGNPGTLNAADGLWAGLTDTGALAPGLKTRRLTAPGFRRQRLSSGCSG
jgi:hypothetical protein